MSAVERVPATELRVGDVIRLDNPSADYRIRSRKRSSTGATIVFRIEDADGGYYNGKYRARIGTRVRRVRAPEVVPDRATCPNGHAMDEGYFECPACGAYRPSAHAAKL